MKRTKGISLPSNRDAIESWLDVLVSMLNLPSSQRTQVRDELEDHLRSRVDDLLIMGKSEPDAIQAAIQELGETAELAKLISSASRTRTPFRRFAMNATFFVLAGSIMTASISMMMPTNTSTTIPGVAEAVVVDTAEIKEPLRHSFDHEREPVVDVLVSIATAYDLSFKFSDSVRKSHSGNMILNTQLNTFKGDYTLQEAVDAIRTRMHMNYGETVLALTDNELILMTLEEHKRMQIEIKAYPVPSWAITSDEQIQFGMAIEQLLRTKHDLEYTTIQAINGSLVVAAPPEVHSEILEMSEQLRELSEQQRAEKQQRQRVMRELKQGQIERLQLEMKQAEGQYNDVLMQKSYAESRREELEQKLHELISDPQRLTQLMQSPEPQDTPDDLRKMIRRERLEIERLEYEAEAERKRADRLREIYVDAEAELILSDLTNPPAESSSPEKKTGERPDYLAPPTVVISGVGVERSGMYQLPETGTITLGRLLTVAEASDTSASVTLRREKKNEVIGTVGDILNGLIEDPQLLESDQVVISAAD
ncbi:MAG: permease prefix domain 1-containing protein [Phycisphaerales bacterium]